MIELLVVVAIISLLISILLPSLSRARSTARMVRCQANQKQIGTAHHMYANESDDWFVPVRANNNKLPWLKNIKWRQIMGMRPGNGSAASYRYPDGLVCPDVPEDRADNPLFNYGNNSTAGNSDEIPDVERNMPYNEGDYSTTSTASGVAKAVRHFRGKIVNPTGKLQGVDASGWFADRGGADWQLGWNIYPEMRGGAGPFGGGYSNQQTSYRHMEGANLLMFDGHVEYRPKAEVFYFTAGGAEDAKRNKNLWYVYR